MLKRIGVLNIRDTGGFMAKVRYVDVLTPATLPKKSGRWILKRCSNWKDGSKVAIPSISTLLKFSHCPTQMSTQFSQLFPQQCHCFNRKLMGFHQTKKTLLFNFTNFHGLLELGLFSCYGEGYGKMKGNGTWDWYMEIVDATELWCLYKCIREGSELIKTQNTIEHPFMSYNILQPSWNLTWHHWYPRPQS